MSWLDSVKGYVDPGAEGFFDRWLALGRRILLAMALFGCVGTVLVARTQFGRYMTAVLLMELGQNERAAEIGRELVSEDPDQRYASHAILATALERSGQGQAALERIDAAVELFPVDWRAHSKRCAIGRRQDAAAHVLDSCQRFVELRPDRDLAYFVLADAHLQVENQSGAIEALTRLVERCSTHPRQHGQCARAETYLTTLRAGGNPFTDDPRDPEQDT